MVRHIADRVAVMYLGKVVELAPARRPLRHAAASLHRGAPVGRARARPRAGGHQRDRIVLQGDVPSPAQPPEGCNFCTRCPKVMDVCRVVDPEFREVRPGHFAACHLLYDHKTAGQPA